LQLSGLDRLCPAYVFWIRAFTCMSVTPAVPYMSTGLAGYSVDPRISRGARKLTRTARVKKKMHRIILELIAI